MNYSRLLVPPSHLGCRSRCPSPSTSVSAAQRHAPRWAEPNQRSAPGPGRCRAPCKSTGQESIGSSGGWRCPAVSDRRWTQNRSWAQDTFRSLTQCVLMSTPAGLLAVGCEDNSRYTFQTSYADLTQRTWKGSQMSMRQRCVFFHYVLLLPYVPLPSVAVSWGLKRPGLSL